MAKRSVGVMAAAAGIIVILAAVGLFAMRICPCSKPPASVSPPTPAQPETPAVIEYPQGSRPDIPPEPPPPTELSPEQKAAMEKYCEKQAELSTQIRAARLHFQAVRVAARKNNPEMQAIVTEIKTVQAHMAQRLKVVPGCAEKEKALEDAKARLRAMTESRMASASGGSLPEVAAAEGRTPESEPDPELAKARESVNQAAAALGAFMADVRNHDAEYVGLAQRARSLRERLDAAAAQKPAVIEAQARLNELSARSTELLKERERILRPDAELNKAPADAGERK